MMAPLTSLVLPFLLSCFSARPAHAIPYRRAAALPPSQDPWYTAPEGYEDAAPGEILRIRPAKDSLIAALGKNASAIYNILYRTSDSFDNPSWAVTTLLVPPEPLHNNGTSLLSYQIPYNTLNLDYSPSYALDTQFASAFSDIIPSLSRGWYVNIPDFEGPRAAFSVSVEEAHATLDSIRAAIAAGNGLRSDTRVALWGYSGGTLPSEFAAEIAPYYAPDINLVGVAIGGLLANVTNALVTIDGQSYAGLSILTTLGLATSYPEVQSYLDTTLKPSGPYNATEFFSAKSLATFDAFARFANQSIGNYFTTGDSWLNAAALKPAISRNWQMGKYFTPQVPLYIYKAIHDEMSPVADTDAVVQKYCVDGANILYERNTVGLHQDEYTNGNAPAYAWLVSVLEGTYGSLYETVGCTIRDVTVSVPIALTELPRLSAGVPW
jgi:hypothetical protein